MDDDDQVVDDSATDDTADEVEQDDDAVEATDQVDEDDAESDDDIDTDADDEDTDDEDNEPEMVKFDFGGDSLEIPKGDVPEELRDRIDEFTKKIWTNYGSKSQDVAAQVKSVEARETAAIKLMNLNGAALDSYSQGMTIQRELQQLRDIDMDALWQSNPDQARRYSDAISARETQYQRLHAQVQAQEQEISTHQTTETTRLMGEGKIAVEKRVPGFEAKAPDVIKYVTETYGIDAKEAETWPMNPAAAEMAYKSMLWDQLQAKATKKPAAPAAKPSRNAKRSGGGSKSTQPSDKDSVDNWLAKRNRQLAKAG